MAKKCTLESSKSKNSRNRIKIVGALFERTFPRISSRLELIRATRANFVSAGLCGALRILEILLQVSRNFQVSV